MQTKICTKCGVEKEITNFRKQKNGKYGVTSCCKDCDKIHYQKNKDNIILKQKQYYLEHPNKKKETDSKYYQTHKEETKVNRTKWRKEHQEEYKNNFLKQSYGITLEEYNKLFEKQNHLCAICGKPELLFDKRINKIRRLCVDHDHVTGKIRGLLCNHCNTALGKFKDNIENLKSAIKYLKG